MASILRDSRTSAITGRSNPGRSLTFKRVKKWWGEKLPVNRGKYNFDRVEVEFYRDSDVAFEAFKAREFDIYIEHQAKNWANGYNFPAVRRGDVLLELDHRTLDSELAQAQAALQEAEAGVVLASANFRRADALAKERLVSAAQVD